MLLRLWASVKHSKEETNNLALKLLELRYASLLCCGSLKGHKCSLHLCLKRLDFFSLNIDLTILGLKRLSDPALQDVDL